MIKNIKKIVLLLIIVSCILVLFSCEKQDENVIEEEKFEIYFATLESVKEYGYYDFEKLELEEEPILTDEDIRAYYWKTHEIEITSTYLDKLNKIESNNVLFDDNGVYRQYEKGGSKLLQSVQYDCFVIVVGGEKVYSGTFSYSPVMSYSTEKIIAADVSNTSFKILYSGQGEDVRNVDSIYNFFNDKGKLQVTDANDLEKKIEELENNIEVLVNKNQELQSENWSLINQYNELVNDKKYYESISNWLESRVKWYMVETLEDITIRNYSDYILILDQSDIDTINGAGDRFRKNANDEKWNNDRMFNLFETYYYSVMKNLEKTLVTEDITEEVLTKGLKNGIIFSIKNNKVVVRPKEGYLLSNYSPYLTESTNEYLKTLDYEISIMNKNSVDSVIENAEIKIPLDDFVDLIIKIENYTYNYGYYNNMPYFYKGREKLLFYFNIYIGKIHLSNSPVYNEDKSLSVNYKDSYINTLIKYPNTETGKMINELYNLLILNNYYRDLGIEEFYQKSKYDLLY